jgi:RNA polymerase sigma-70 factor (ECF subfamily)
MAQKLPDTPISLLLRLRDEDKQAVWQVSWKRFLELYYGPLTAMASGIYRHHTGESVPPQDVLEDVVAQVVSEFFKRNQFDPGRARLRTYLRVLTNARVVDFLRKQRPLNHVPLDSPDVQIPEETPGESAEEARTFQQSLLATLIEDLRETIPLRHFQIFEMVKLHGMPPGEVAAELGVSRGVVDNTVYKVMQRLREIASAPEYQGEYYP